MLKIVPIPQEVKILSDKLFDYKLKDLKKVTSEGYPPEGYRLLIDDTGINAFASTDKGHFYALATLEQLLEEGRLPNAEITDFPVYKYRGYMLDCARHFFSVETVKKQIDAISKLKLNIFHWHLTEDQGWRIEIDKYPLLTEVGSYRKQTRGDGKPVSGYYTKNEIREVVEYARERFIDIIPEIDIPGHMSAAIASYPHISCTGQPIEVKESFGIHTDVVCAGKEESYQFLFDVLDEVIELFPYEYIHLGGDEALRQKWLDCPLCQRKIEDEGLKNEHELQGYFMKKMVEYLSAKGKKVINWNDGLIGENTADNIVVHYWQQGKESTAAAIREINKGKQAIISPFYSYYLDYPYGMTSLKKTYSFNPLIKGIKDTTNILGLEAPLWTEYVTSEKQLEYQTYPRLIALAEAAWSKREDRNYKDFLKRLTNIFKVFDKMGIRYAMIRNANPNLIAGKLEVIKFFKRAMDKNSIKNVLENGRRLKAKYNKK